jgi:hypothetical protein
VSGRKTIACDLDGTLAEYDRWRGIEHIGKPIERTLRRVRAALAAGHAVEIFTARVAFADDADTAGKYIEDWCRQHVGQVLPVTCIKGGHFTEFWDDRAVGVHKNAGRERHNYTDTIWSELGDD